jgi:2'-hydroxyisoflavone reductase
MNAYADLSRPGTTEDAPLHEDEAEEYGPLKAACERVVDGALIVRSGLIAGAYDPTFRFTWWAERIAGDREFLAPGPPERPCQLIDARDEADWIVRSAEAGLTGAFNVTGEPTTLGAVVGDAAPAVWVDSDWLIEQGVEEWTELPLWVTDPAFDGFLSFDVSKAVAAGLTFRPLAETIRSALEHPGPPAGMTREREAELLAAWRSEPGRQSVA